MAHRPDGDRLRVLPRLTRKVFWDLALWMVGFGLCVGVIFPPFAVLLGVPSGKVMTPTFFVATLGSGFAVGAVNYLLSRWVVGRRLRTLSGRMQVVEGALREAMFSGDWSSCDPERCRIEVDSTDELGESAAAFNGLVDALAGSHRIEEAVRSFTATVNQNLEVERLSQEALEHFRQRTGAQGGAMFVHRDTEWVQVASVGLSRIGGLTGIAWEQAFRADRAVRIDVPEDVTIDALAVAFRPRVVLLVPVSFESKPLAVVVLASGGELDHDSERLIDLLRRTLGVALHNAISHEQMERLAAVDPLTGLYNRRFGLARLREEFGRARREASSLGLLIFDIDHFKSINDTCGHLVGDRVLEQVSRASRAVIREGDVLIRYGGDEFVAILPLASQPDVAAVGERIRLAVADSHIGNGQPPVRVTVSVGAAVYPDNGVTSPDELLRMADEALYEAKTGDRNRLVLARD